VRDDRDHVTIVDLLQRRQNLTRMRVECTYRRMANARRYPYLECERCVPAAVLLSARFAGRMRIDSRGNTVFPHFDVAGLCGYEIKNRGFTGFAAGGQKGLWFSHARPDDRRLVLAESAIDALSHAALFPDAEDQTRYASLGGKPSSRQTGLLQATIARLPEGAEIVTAFDADEVGRKLADVIREAVAGVARRTKRTDLIFKGQEYYRGRLARTGKVKLIVTVQVVPIGAAARRPANGGGGAQLRRKDRPEC
jgi:hypothetical protein